jgi:hypothetical protein
MKNARFRSLAFWFFIGLCPPWLGHCGGDAGLGTESGNPPVVTGQKLTLVATATGVSVMGSVGAVSPAAASVRVTNVTSGASEDGVVASDGSFAVAIAGSLSDEYEVTVTSAGSTTTVRVTPNDGGATEDTSAASCNDLENQLSQRLGAVFEAAPRACTVDADCTEVGWGSCYNSCSSSVIARSGVELTATLADQAGAATCAALEGCTRIPPPCVPRDVLAVCIAGSCQELDGDAQSCEALSSRAQQERADAFAAADVACQSDRDCYSFPTGSSDCAPTCPGYVAVSANAAAPLQDRMTAVEETVCRSYAGHSCDLPLQLPCPATPGTPNAICRSNQCEIEYPQLP